MPTPLYSIDNLAAGKLSIMPHPRGGEYLADVIKDLRAANVDILISLLSETETSGLELDEEAVHCANQGIDYLSFPITDFGVPPFSMRTFRFLKQLNEQLSQGKHIALHCYQGIGRSGLMAASLLTLTGLPAEQAFDQLSQVRGNTVPETDEQRAWVQTFSQIQQTR